MPEQVPEKVVDGEEQMLARFVRGEAAAFAEVVREHQAMVFSLALHFLRDSSLAEDLAQDVFLQLYQNRASIESPGHLRFWLRRVTCHRSLDRIRQNGSRRTISLDDAPEPAVIQETDDPLLRRRLWVLIDTLPEKRRMALILRFQEDLTYQEISEVLEMPVNTVKSSLERGLALLREKLARSMGAVRQ